jgi:hypothetical protein
MRISFSFAIAVLQIVMTVLRFCRLVDGGIARPGPDLNAASAA